MLHGENTTPLNAKSLSKRKTKLSSGCVPVKEAVWGGDKVVEWKGFKVDTKRDGDFEACEGTKTVRTDNRCKQRW